MQEQRPPSRVTSLFIEELESRVAPCAGLGGLHASDRAFEHANPNGCLVTTQPGTEVIECGTGLEGAGC